jgi:hypothetical protein
MPLLEEGLELVWISVPVARYRKRAVSRPA